MTTSMKKVLILVENLPSPFDRRVWQEANALREAGYLVSIICPTGKGYDLRVYDRNVKLAAIKGANKDYILNKIPHISKLMVASIDEVLEHAETVVIGNAAAEFRDVPRRLREGQQIVDLVRICDTRTVAGVYEGICW